MLKIDKWITFTSDLLPLVMSGAKTVTRRVIVPQPIRRDEGWFWQKGTKLTIAHSDEAFAKMMIGRCPYGQSGTILGIKEGYQIIHDIPRSRFVTGEYLVDGARFEVELNGSEWDKWSARKFPYRATPGRFMYRSLCRTRLLNKSVRVERVQDITESDAEAEGVAYPGWDPWKRANSWVLNFRVLWDKINKKRGHGWDVNDWVWRVEFEVME